MFTVFCHVVYQITVLVFFMKNVVTLLSITNEEHETHKFKKCRPMIYVIMLQVKKIINFLFVTWSKAYKTMKKAVY